MCQLNLVVAATVIMVAANSVASDALGATSTNSLPVGVIQTVALSNSPAPAGGAYDKFELPILNESGQLAFRANLVGQFVTQGIFAGDVGTIEAVAIRGAPAPSGGDYNGFDLPVLNDAGQVAFFSYLRDGSSNAGVFFGAPGHVQAVALNGAPSPVGGAFGFLGPPVLNAYGHVAFNASIVGGTTTDGIFGGLPGSVQPIVLRNDAASVGGEFDYFGPPVLNSGGQTAFLGGVNGGPSPEGLFVGAQGLFQAAALKDSAAPAGGSYSTFPNVTSFNESGQLAFFATLAGGSSSGGLFAGAAGAVEAVALVDSPAPAGGNYWGFRGGEIDLNSSGQVAFSAILFDGTFSNGLFVGVPGTLQTIAVTDTPAPGGGSIRSLGAPALNAFGQVVFGANLSGPGISTANDAGLYAGSAGQLVKIVGEGDVLDVDSGPGLDWRTVRDAGLGFNRTSGGDDGRQSSFSDSGYVAFRLEFTDGSSGIFLTRIAPVPEPNTRQLLAMLLATMWGVCNQRNESRKTD